MLSGQSLQAGVAGRKSVEVGHAVAFWPLLLPEWRLCACFCAFVARHSAAGHLRFVSRDTWRLAMEFAARQPGPDAAALAAGYDEDAPENCSWPVLVDEFVDDCKKTAGQGK
jgi:hypothetical protein